jgi:CspA family cold shock protein
VLDTAETPGGCWVHFSQLDHDGYRALRDVTTVELEWVRHPQDGYPYQAVRVVVPGKPPAGASPPQAPGGAYRSELVLHADDTVEPTGRG